MSLSPSASTVADDSNQDSRLGRWLLATVLAWHIAFTGWQLLAERVPSQHDAVQYLTLQYYYLNNRVMAGEVPQWIPHLTHGSAGTVYYPLTASLLQNTLLLTGLVPENANFFYLFHLAFLIDELLLLVGMWLWCGRLGLSAPARALAVFVASCTCLWQSQPWFNFHIYYALPMILYLGHRFIDTQQLRYALLALNLLGVQMLGSLAYFIPMTSFLIFAYFLCYFSVERGELKRLLGTLGRPVPLIVVLAWAVLSLAPVYVVQTHGFETVAFQAPDRNADGSVSQHVFLTYGESLHLGKWLDVFFGAPVSKDNTLYIGLICLPMCLLGAVGQRKRAFPAVGMVILLILLGSKYFPAPLVYYWPKMNYYRHLGLLGTVTKIFLILLAGMGVDRVFFKKDAFPARWLLWASAAAMFGMAFATFSLASDPEGFLAFFRRLGLAAIDYRPELEEEQLRYQIVVAWASAVFFLLLAFNQRRRLKLSGALFAFVLIMDLGAYKYRNVELNTHVLSKAGYDAFYFTPMPFAQRRCNPIEYVPETLTDPYDVFYLQKAGRRKLLADNSRFDMIAMAETGFVSYGTNNAFLFFDELGSSYRTQYWQQPFNDYFEAYWSNAGRDFADVEKYWHFDPHWGLVFPMHHPAACKISGSTEDKIQFFSTAMLVEDAHKTAAMITEKSYAGDLMFLQSPPGQTGAEDFAPVLRADEGLPLESNRRLHPGYRVSRFDANHLEVVVDNDSGQPIWLLYSDVWHPWWHATVNGLPRSIFIANLAYKAVALAPGRNVVHFHCRSPTLSWLFLVLGLFSTFWTLAVLYATIALLLGEVRMCRLIRSG